jgi:hypothetical protein
MYLTPGISKFPNDAVAYGLYALLALYPTYLATSLQIYAYMHLSHQVTNTIVAILLNKCHDYLL